MDGIFRDTPFDKICRTKYLIRRRYLATYLSVPNMVKWGIMKWFHSFGLRLKCLLGGSVKRKCAIKNQETRERKVLSMDANIYLLQDCWDLPLPTTNK